MGVLRRPVAFLAVILGCAAVFQSATTVSARDRPKHTTKLRHSRHLDYLALREAAPSLTTTPLPKLHVMDNHKPIFKDCLNYKPSVKEEQPSDTYVFTVKAYDVDPPESGGLVSYTFIGASGERDRFKINNRTGVVLTSDIFDHDEPSREKVVYITVRASDNGNPRLDDACTIRIVIEDINDNQPVFDKVSYAESVPQDLPVGREVMRISATDIDEGKNSLVHYSLDTNSPDQAYFIIDGANGLIFLNKTIDKPPGYNFRLNAIVKDEGDPPLQSSIALDITVIESNKKSPSFVEVPDQPIRLKENYIDYETAIAVVSATSNIPNAKKVQFELVQGQTEQTNKYHTFVMKSEVDTAVIKLGNHLDYEKNTEYTLTVRIQNNDRLAAETIITILVEDVNDNIPSFSEIRSGSVLENEPVGTFVMQVRAVDADGTSEHNQITYSLLDQEGLFNIDFMTGNITTLRSFDREKINSYNIEVAATDNSESALIPGQHNIGQQSFFIEIADKNDNAPRFDQDTYIAESIAENVDVNALVTVVKAVDIDTASVLRYSIVKGNTYNAFSIRDFTGEIRVNNELDYENITSYSLDVRAYDGVYEDYAKVVIRIENMNDNPPVFVANYTKKIEEERLYEGCIVKVEAYDPDIKDRKAPQNIVYSLIKSEQMAFLDIDNDGCLRLTKPLDRDQPTGYERWQILIVANDHGGKLGSESLRSTTEVILELTDINDNAPFLTNTEPVIWYENQSHGPIVTLTAKDYDSPENGPPFTFALNDTASDYKILTRFKIQGNELIAIATFDREERKEYNIPVLITDAGSPRMTGQSILRVVIGDRNDNAMGPGNSKVFVYNFKGQSPDVELGRPYVEDPDDWDLNDKRFMWRPNYEARNRHFDLHSRNGMVTMKMGTLDGTYDLQFNVTEEYEPKVPYHWVKADMTVIVKTIPEEAVDKSGSIRFVNTTAEQFIVPEVDGLSKKDKLVRRLSKLFNTSQDNVDIFTLLNKQTVKYQFLDVRYSVHGSPYYFPVKLNSMVTAIQGQLEDELQVSIYMVGINECLIEGEQCSNSCRTVLVKSNVPLGVYTNTTSFIGVSARTEPVCSCEVHDPQTTCYNGGTPVVKSCECPENYSGDHCELTSVGFEGDGWAMYPPIPVCSQGHFSLVVTAHNNNSLIMYMGPLAKNNLLDLKDFMSLELKNGYPVLYVNYGTGTTRLNNSVVFVADGKPHLIEVLLMMNSIEMYVDRCKMSDCMYLAAPNGKGELLNINGPIHLGGSSVSLNKLSKELDWGYTPTENGFVGCISNMTFNGYVYDLGQPARSLNVVPCNKKSTFTAVSFGIDSNFLWALLICIAVLVVLLLAVVVHRRRSDAWAEKELDDIRENIIAYEDEGGGEGDAGYDLHVLRQMYEGPPPDNDGFLHATGLNSAAPDISGFLDDKKTVMDRDPETPFDDVRFYAYEGDGNTSGSLSSLASCTDDGDLNFNHLATFGPRFRKLADIYGDSASEDRQPHEESWC